MCGSGRRSGSANHLPELIRRLLHGHRVVVGDQCAEPLRTDCPAVTGAMQLSPEAFWVSTSSRRARQQLAGGSTIACRECCPTGPGSEWSRSPSHSRRNVALREPSLSATFHGRETLRSVLPKV